MRSSSRRPLRGLLRSLLIPGLLAAALPVRADETDPLASASSVSVVTRGEIEARQWRTLADVLRSQPGVYVSQLGGVGQATQIFFRGQRSGRVLLRIDGVDVSDPGARDPGLVVPDLQTLEIERIEVRRGPQGSSAGSDAVGGVIDVVTRRGDGAVTPWAAFEAGSFRTTQQSLGLSGGDARVAYTLGYSNLHSAGTTATARDPDPAERDAYENDSIAGRLDLVASQALSFTLTGRFIRSDVQADRPSFELPFGAIDFSSADLADDRRELERGARQLFLGGSANLELWKGRWSQQWSVHHARHERHEDGAFQRVTNGFQTLTDAIGKNTATTDSDSTRLSLAWTNELELAPEHVLRFGAETTRESFERSTRAAEVFDLALLDDLDDERDPGSPVFFLGSSPVFLLRPASLFLEPNGLRQRTGTHRHRRDFALFAEDRFTFLEHFFAEGGIRLNDQGEYGSRLSYRAGLGYVEPRTGLKLFANLATGYRDPELRSAAAIASVQSRTRDESSSSIPGLVRVNDFALVPFLILGDESLEPEVTRGLEIGAEIPLGANGIARLGYFSTRSRGVLGLRGGVFDPAERRVQLRQDDVLQTRSRGLEISAELIFPFGAQLALGYTYTRAGLRHGEPDLFPPEPTTVVFFDALRADGSVALVRRRIGGDAELGIPRHQGSVSLQITRWDPLSVVLSGRYVGSRRSESEIGPIFGTFLRPSTEHGFMTADLALAYRIGERFSVFSRIENLFDREHGEGFGSQRPGRAAYVGVATRY